MTTILSLLFLKINVRFFSQSLTDGLAQFYHSRSGMLRHGSAHNLHNLAKWHLVFIVDILVT